MQCVRGEHEARLLCGEYDGRAGEQWAKAGAQAEQLQARLCRLPGAVSHLPPDELQPPEWNRSAFLRRL